MCYEEVSVQIRCVWQFRIGLARPWEIVSVEANGSQIIELKNSLNFEPHVPSPLITREEGRMRSDIPLFYKWSVVNCQRLTIYAIVISRMA